MSNRILFQKFQFLKHEHKQTKVKLRDRKIINKLPDNQFDAEIDIHRIKRVGLAAKICGTTKL